MLPRWQHGTIKQKMRTFQLYLCRKLAEHWCILTSLNVFCIHNRVYVYMRYIHISPHWLPTYPTYKPTDRPTLCLPSWHMQVAQMTRSPISLFDVSMIGPGCLLLNQQLHCPLNEHLLLSCALVRQPVLHMFVSLSLPVGCDRVISKGHGGSGGEYFTVYRAYPLTFRSNLSVRRISLPHYRVRLWMLAANAQCVSVFFSLSTFICAITIFLRIRHSEPKCRLSCWKGVVGNGRSDGCFVLEWDIIWAGLFVWTVWVIIRADAIGVLLMCACIEGLCDWQSDLCATSVLDISEPCRYIQYRHLWWDQRPCPL